MAHSNADAKGRRYGPYPPMARWPRLYHEILAPLFARRLYWQRFEDQPRIALVVLSSAAATVWPVKLSKQGLTERGRSKAVSGRGTPPQSRGFRRAARSRGSRCL